MHRGTRRALVSVLMALAAGCSAEPSAPVPETARITQVVRFADTQPFNAPVAAGSTLLVAIERLDGQALSTNLSLNLIATGSGQLAANVPIGVAQYAVTLTSVGTYNLVAQNGGQTVATRTVTAAPEGGLGLSSVIQVVTTGTNRAGLSCASTEALDNTHGLTLSANQSLIFSIVPLGTDGGPMLGTLTLVATGQRVRVDSPAVGSDALGNTLTATPLPGAKGPASVRVVDQVTTAAVTVEFAVNTDQADARCN